MRTSLNITKARENLDLQQMKEMALTTTVKISESIKVFQRKGVIKSSIASKCIQLHKMAQRKKSDHSLCLLMEAEVVIQVAVGGGRGGKQTKTANQRNISRKEQ